VVSNPCLKTEYMRRKELSSMREILTPKKIVLDQDNIIYCFDPAEIIKNKLDRSEIPITDSYPMDCIPLYARGMKEKFHSSIITSFLDSPAHERILSTVPYDQHPPVIFSIYADGIDRDNPLHSSLKNKLHCTYLRILNVCQFGGRSRDDYELAMMINEKSIRNKGYSMCHEGFVAGMKKLIDSGITINGKNHAVRLAYIQVGVSVFSIKDKS